MEDSPPVDRRIERTRAQLRSAVLQLATDRELSDITVQDITRRAGVNRATFYQHYRDKDDLVEQTIDELLAELFDACAPVQAGIEQLSAEAVHPSTIAMFEQFGRRAGLYRRLIGDGHSGHFVRRFHEYIEPLSIHAMELTSVELAPREIPQLLRAHANAAVALSVARDWLNSGQLEPAEVVARWCWQLSLPMWFNVPSPSVSSVS